MATVTFDATITASPGSTFTGSLDYIEPVPASNYAAWSQEQANRGMSGGTILSNVTLAPDGTMTADKMVEAVDTNAVHRITVPSSIKGFATISMFVKPAERSALQVYHEDFDINRYWSSASTSWRFSGTPALIQNYTGVPNSVRFISSTCVDLNNNGWYRLTFTTYNSLTTPGTPTFYISLVNGSNVNYYNGDGSSGLFIWGIQLEPGKVASDRYVPTNATGRSGFKVNLDGSSANCTDLTTKAGNIVRYSNMKTSNDSGFINASAGWDLGVDYSVTDPDGYRGARHFALGNASAPLRINSGSYVNTPEGSGTNQPKYAGQLWIRIADGGPNISLGMIQINDSNALVNFATTPITQTWQKFTFTVNNNGNPFQFIDIEFNASDAYRRIHIYGAQLELGTTNSAYVETGANKIMGISSNARFL